MTKKILSIAAIAAILVPGPAVTEALAQVRTFNAASGVQGVQLGGLPGQATLPGASEAGLQPLTGGAASANVPELQSLSLPEGRTAPAQKAGRSASYSLPSSPEAAPSRFFGSNEATPEGSRSTGAKLSKRSAQARQALSGLDAGSEAAITEVGRLFDATGARGALSASPEARSAKSASGVEAGSIPSFEFQGREAAASKGAKVSTVLHSAPEDGQGPSDGPKAPEKGSKFFTAPLIAFLAGLVVTQVGAEFLGQSMPQLVRTEFGGFQAMAQLAIFSSVARIFGSAIGGAMAETHGEKKLYIGSDVAKAVSIGIMVTLLVTHHMTMPLMMGFYSLNGLFTGVGLTAEKTIPSKLVGQDQTRLEKYWGVNQFVLEIIGVSAPIVAGMLIAATGTFSYAVAVYPAAVFGAAAILWKWLKLPEAPAELSKPAAPAAGAPAKKSIGDRFKEIFTKIGDGAKIVWKDPSLRTAFLAYTAFMLVNPLLYSVIAPAYGNFVVGGVAAKAASVQSWVVGMYSLGGLGGAALMMWEGKKIEKGQKDGSINDDQAKQMAQSSTLKWMGIGAVSLLAFTSLMFTAAPVAYGAMFLFGLGSVVPTIKLQSMVQALSPQAGVAKVMGFVQAASILVSTSGLYALGRLFDALPSDVLHAGGMSLWKAGAFLNGGFVLLALGYLGLRLMLKKKLSK